MKKLQAVSFFTKRELREGLKRKIHLMYIECNSIIILVFCLLSFTSCQVTNKQRLVHNKREAAKAYSYTGKYQYTPPVSEAKSLKSFAVASAVCAAVVVTIMVVELNEQEVRHDKN